MDILQIERFTHLVEVPSKLKFEKKVLALKCYKKILWNNKKNVETLFDKL